MSPSKYKGCEPLPVAMTELPMREASEHSPVLASDSWQSGTLDSIADSPGGACSWILDRYCSFSSRTTVVANALNAPASTTSLPAKNVGFRERGLVQPVTL